MSNHVVARAYPRDYFVMTLAVILLAIGLGLVLAEVRFPSSGLFSIPAGLCILIADVLAAQHGGRALAWAFILGEMILIPTLVAFTLRRLPSHVSGVTQLNSLSHLLGTRGRAVTELSPHGEARFGDLSVRVVSLDGVIEKGGTVLVESVDGDDLRVRAVGHAKEDA